MNTIMQYFIVPSQMDYFVKVNRNSGLTSKLALLDFVVKHNGEIELPKTLFRNSWQIRKIRAVYFNEKFDIEQDDDKWNAYVDRIRVAIGVDCYCEWVRNKDGDIIGIMAFYNSKGDEIKVKHFDKWNQLWQDVQRHLRSGVQIVETKTSCQNSTNAVLCAGILDVLCNDWGNKCGEFEAYWFGYESLKDALHERLIYVNVATIKSAMKELSKQNKVELRQTYDENYKISGRGWFACT